MEDTITLPKVNIRDLIGRAGFSLNKTVVPPYDIIKTNLHPVYFDDDDVIKDYIKNKVGETCFILQDNCSPYYIRYVYVGAIFPTTKYLTVIDRLGVFSDDLLFTHIVEYIFGSQYDKGLIEDEETKKYMLDHYNCAELYDYITEHNIDIGSDITYLYAIKTGDVKYFEPLFE